MFRCQYWTLVYFLILQAGLVFVCIWICARSVSKISPGERVHEKRPSWLLNSSRGQWPTRLTSQISSGVYSFTETMYQCIGLVFDICRRLLLTILTDLWISFKYWIFNLINYNYDVKAVIFINIFSCRVIFSNVSLAKQIWIITCRFFL